MLYFEINLLCFVMDGRGCVDYIIFGVCDRCDMLCILSCGVCGVVLCLWSCSWCFGVVYFVGCLWLGLFKIWFWE